MMNGNRVERLTDLLALVAGALLPLSLSPFNFWPLAFIAPLMLYVSTESCSAAAVLRRFYLFNVAMFGVGTSWIYVSIHTYGGASAVLAAFLVALFVLAYSMVCLPQAWIYARWLRGRGAATILAFAGIWVLQEWFRAWFLTGFPWLFTGYGLIETPLRAWAPVGGVYLLSLTAVLVGVCLWSAIRQRSVWLSIPVVVIALGAVILNQISFTTPGRIVSVSLIQGNIDQHVKWQPANRLPILNRYMSATEPELGRDLIIWPEASITFFKQDATRILDQIQEVAAQRHSTVVLGIPDRDADGGFQNTVLALGEGQGQYIKRRLVPFGEYVPLEDLLRGLIRFFNLPMSRNEPGPWEQPPLVAGTLRLSTSICYEVVYPDLVRTTVDAPDLLVTVSNDTWFGTSIGPWQHLQMVRMRALENGRSLARATNNGVTALINHQGRVISTLPQFESGILRGDLEVRGGATPFHRFGSLPVLLLALGFLLAGPLLARLKSGS